jgi:hypothetical protein
MLMVVYSLLSAVMYDTLQEDKIWRSVTWLARWSTEWMGGNVVGVNGWRLEVRNMDPSLHHIPLRDQVLANAVVSNDTNVINASIRISLE